MKDSALRPALRELLTRYAAGVGTDLRGALRDAVTELNHIAVADGINFVNLVESGMQVYEEEITLASLNASKIEHIHGGK